MCDDRSEENLDAELRNVEVPRGMFARLKQVTQTTDGEIDTALCALPIPSGLAGRVKAVVADDLLDESLREVEIPSDLLARLRIIPEVRKVSALRRFALAASLLLIMTGSFFGTLGGLLASIRPLASAATTLHVIDVGPTQLVAAPFDVVRVSTGHANPIDLTTVPVVWRGGPLRVELVRLDETRTLGPAGQLIRDVERGLALGSDVLLMRWDAYASPQQASQRLPELEQIRRVPNAGVDLPFVGGYDRSFLHRTSTHPPVFIAANERLPSIRVPLSTSVASFCRAEQLVDDGRLPDEQEVRPEDFLAAVGYEFAPPSNEDLSVTLVAGRAPFGNQKRSLLQVGVKAARRIGDLATHVSLVVDVSQSMRQQRRLDTLRESLRTMFAHLGPDDSISLVAVNHEVTQQIDFAMAGGQDQLEMWLRALQAGGGDRLEVGVLAALSLALAAPRDAGVLRQLVVVTDGVARLTADQRQQLGELLAVAAENDVRTTMLQFGDHAAMSDQPAEGDASIAAVTSDGLPWKLVELATGVSSLVARQVQVQVNFNPKAVLAYRLVGHGPSAMAGLGDDVWATDLRSGQEATLLFEVWMHDSYEDEVASAGMHWLAVDSDEPRQSGRASLGRYDVATIWLESAPSLQAAAIAAEIGERFRGVGAFELFGNQRFRERRKPVGWTDIIEAAAKVSPEVAAREDFQRLIDLVRKTEELRRRARSGTTL